MASIILGIIGIALFLASGYFTTRLLMKKDEHWLVIAGISLGSSVIISIALGLILALLHAFNQRWFLLSLMVINAALILIHARR